MGEYAEIARQLKGKLKEAWIEVLRAGFKRYCKEMDFIVGECFQRIRADNLLVEDEVLLQFYYIAGTRVCRERQIWEPIVFIPKIQPS